MPSGTAIKPGDIITQYNGKTVEINNTDAEGRLILADALAYAIEQGADRVVDIATLTGAVLIALGSTYAAVISNDDELAGEVEAAGERDRRAGLAPAPPPRVQGADEGHGRRPHQRRAPSARPARSPPPRFLEEFVGDTPWAHLDIAGTAWDVGRAYTGNDASGFGVRLLAALARSRRLS